MHVDEVGEMERESECSSHEHHLPENCISHIISLTSPCDACRCAAVSMAFHTVVASDTVWERFLPLDYADIMARAAHPPVQYASKRELYAHLCDGVLLDDGKFLWLERRSGAKCYILPAKKLSLPWDDGDYCWRWISHPRSRFAEVAELMDSTCLDVHGKIHSKSLSPRTTYAACLVFDTVHGHHGLSFPDQETTITAGGCVSRRVVCLQPSEADMDKFRRVHLPASGDIEAPTAPRARQDGWMEMEMGEFHIDEAMDEEIIISFEILGWYPKRGLVIEGIEIRPVRL